METIKEKVQEMTQLILDGKAMNAFEKYYHTNVIMQENETVPTIGKDANRNRELEFFENITDFRKAEVQGVAIGENLSTVIWHFDYTHKQWGLRKYTQVSVQHWQDGQIIKEQFFYGN